MESQIVGAFPQVASSCCLKQLNDITFGVNDAINAACYITLDTSNADFVVENSTSSSIGILVIDQCVWNDACGHGKCDFAMYSATEFCFVELKTKAKQKQWSNHRGVAVKQLEETVGRFVPTISKLGNYRLEAYIAFGNRPHSTGVLSKSQSTKRALHNKYKVELLEGNKKVFF